MKPRTIVLRTAGTNCDRETAHAFRLAGGESSIVHLNRLLNEPGMLRDFQILAIPGGFSYGDDISAGRIFANQLGQHLADPLREFVEAGKPIIGICNGFQVLVKLGLLPGAMHGRSGPLCTLVNNDCGRFVDRWIHLVPRSDKCIWTRDLQQIDLPVAHGEGKFVPADDALRQALWNNDQVALIYSLEDGSPAVGRFPDNPNGSVDDIAGICDATGLVLGLMPHPERSVEVFQHPSWGKGRSSHKFAAGLQVFQNAVRYISSIDSSAVLS